MLPYYVLIGAPILFAFAHSLAADRPHFGLNRKNYGIPLFFTLYFLLLALRSSTIGIDTASYLSSFERSRYYPWHAIKEAMGWEIGFSYFTKLIACFTDNPQIYLGIIAAITVFPIARMYYRESEDDLSTIALFLIFPLFLMNFSGLRQAIAIAFAPAVYYATRERKLWRVFLLVAVATLFHSSAFVLLLLYPVYHMNLGPKHLWWLIPSFMITFFFSAQLYNLILRLLGTRYVERYAEISETGAYTMIILFALFVAYAFLAPSEDTLDEDTRGLRNILVLVLMIQLFAPSASSRCV